jgi:hypothetical protein
LLDVGLRNVRGELTWENMMTGSTSPARSQCSVIVIDSRPPHWLPRLVDKRRTSSQWRYSAAIRETNGRGAVEPNGTRRIGSVLDDARVKCRGRWGVFMGG